MRLIDADALFKYLPLKVCVPCPFGEEKECRDCVVDKVMQRIEEAPTIAAPRWVRCEEELPDTPRMVIAYVDQWHIFAAYHSSRGEWKQADGFTVIGVTHWMPIEPPKEGK